MNSMITEEQIKQIIDNELHSVKIPLRDTGYPYNRVTAYDEDDMIAACKYFYELGCKDTLKEINVD